MRRYFHPVCIFESFLNVRSFTSVIKSVEDIESFALLRADDQLMVQNLIAESCDRLCIRRSTAAVDIECRSDISTKAKPVSLVQSKLAKKPPRLDLAGLRIMYTNADQLTREKLSQLISRVSDQKPHIVLVNEIKPKNTTKQWNALDFGLPNFTPHPVNIDSKNGRGLITYVNSALDNHVTKLEVEDPLSSEVCWLSISLRGNDKLLLGHIYRNPSHPDNHEALRKHISSTLHNLGKAHTHHCICGDFNYKNIDWKNDSAPGLEDHDMSEEAKFLELTKDLFLTQHVNKITRARGRDEPSLLDLVLTNNPDMVSEVKHQAPLCKSDHSILSFTIDCYFEPPKPQTKFSFDKGDYAALSTFLGNCSWSEGTSVNDKWKNFMKNVVAAHNAHIPTYTSNGKPTWKSNSIPEFDKTTKDILKEKDRMHQLSIEHRNKPDAEKYRKQYNRARNKATAHTRKKKRNFEKDIARDAKKNPKRFWQYCQSKTTLRSGISPLLKDRADKSSIVSKDVEKAEVLQTQFCSVFTHEGDEPLPEFPSRCDNKIDHIHIDESLVLKKLKALNVTKSAGPDGVHPRVLRECAEQVAKPLTEFFQMCVDSGSIPDEWKESIISPIFKKGQRNLAENYRPVALTSIVCKLAESIIREAIMEHLVRNKLLTKKQFGFLKGRSTALQLLTFLDKVASDLRKGRTMDTIYLDYHKAFDTVLFRRHTHKLKAYGISGSLLAWITSFLTGRTQRVRVNGDLSDPQPVISGVPQSSVLGPLFCFLVSFPAAFCPLAMCSTLFLDDLVLPIRAGIVILLVRPFH